MAPEDSNSSCESLHQSCGGLLCQPVTVAPCSVFSWALPTMQTDSPPPVPSNHRDDQARELADVLKGILQMQALPGSRANPCSQVLPPAQISNPLSSGLGHLSSAASPGQLEEYVNELVPALQLVNRTNGLNVCQRQEAIKFAADAVLAKKAVGMGWSHALSNRLACSASDLPKEYQAQETSGDACAEKGEFMALDGASSCTAMDSCVAGATENSDPFSEDLEAFPTYGSLETDSSRGCVEVHGVSGSSMVDSTSELMDDDGVCNSVEEIPAPQLATGICVAAATAIDEPMQTMPTSSSAVSSDSVVTPESTGTTDLHQVVPIVGELARSSTELERGELNESYHAVESGMEGMLGSGDEAHNRYDGTIQGLEAQCLGMMPSGTVIGHPCQGILPGVDHGGVAVGMPSESPMNSKLGSSSSLPATPSLFSLPSSPLFAPNNPAPFPGGAFPSVDRESMRELTYRVAAFQPIDFSLEAAISKPKRRNVKISKDPQSIAARRRRERISDRIRILQRLVPGGTKMDTASMLDEAIHYVKFLKMQVQAMESLENWSAASGGSCSNMYPNLPTSFGYNMGCTNPNLFDASQISRAAAQPCEAGYSAAVPPCFVPDHLQQQSCH